MSRATPLKTSAWRSTSRKATSAFCFTAPDRRSAPRSRSISVADLHSSEHVTCQEVVELVTDYLEGALTPEEAALFEQHLNFCDGCDRYVDQLRATVATVGRIEQEEVPEAMQAKLLNAFRDRRRS